MSSETSIGTLSGKLEFNINVLAVRRRNTVDPFLKLAKGIKELQFRKTQEKGR